MTKNKIVWLGHASIRIEGEKIIYVDPWELESEQPKADIILITHSHHDHLSGEDVDKIRGPETAIFAPPDCAGQLPSGYHPVSPGQRETVDGVEIEAVPAYNTEKQFHLRSSNWVGYIVRMGGERIYLAGDTDYVPEMEKIKAEVAIVPVGGTYTMDAAEAARAVNKIKPELAIPIHFGKVVGSARDAENFQKLCQVPVEILPVSR
jgi:L-ascorbate metabolism protein UlaG (beta-lactamase superfamily)